MLESAQLHSVTEARILEAVLRSRAGVTRSELAATLRLTAPSVVRALSGMLERGLLIDELRRPASGGRVRGVLRVVPEAAAFAGVTIEGDDENRDGCVVRGSVVDLAGEVTADPVECRLLGSHWGEVTDAVVEVLAQLRDRDRRLNAAGISISGHVDTRYGVVHYSPRLRWSGRPVQLGRDVEEKCGLPVIVENDANALALFDRLHGVARNCDWFASLLVGQGVGAGLFTGTAVAVGETGRAGEVGHLWVCAEGKCGCGRIGCLEAQVGSEHLIDRLQQQRAIPRGATTAEAVAEVANQDPEGRAAKELKRCGVHLGRVIAAVCNITDVRLISVRHTGLFDSTVFAAAVLEELDSRLYPSPGPVELPTPMRLTSVDLIRAAAAAALFGALRTFGIEHFGGDRVQAGAAGS